MPAGFAIVSVTSIQINISEPCDGNCFSMFCFGIFFPISEFMPKKATWTCVNMDVSKNNGTPKWMVYNGKPYEQMDDLGGSPLFLETPISQRFIFARNYPKTNLTSQDILIPWDWYCAKHCRILQHLEFNSKIHLEKNSHDNGKSPFFNRKYIF